jgi:hypothetical protein
MNLTGGFGMDAGIEKAACEQATLAGRARPHNPNLTERLEMQIAELEEQLAKRKEALAELKKYPDMEKLFNVLQRL